MHRSWRAVFGDGCKPKSLGGFCLVCEAAALRNRGPLGFILYFNHCTFHVSAITLDPFEEWTTVRLDLGPVVALKNLGRIHFNFSTSLGI